MRIDEELKPADLRDALDGFWQLSGRKLDLLRKSWDASQGAPVFTIDGRYTTRGWTEWTQGFMYGSALLQFDATGDEDWLQWGRQETLERMAVHVTHFGVHDHGFNNVSTYGNLLRLMKESRLQQDDAERRLYELALKASGSVQARRWTQIADGSGFIHSFNGPHSLFVDTIRSCRALAVAHQLGHVMMGENDERISLLERLLSHALNTARYNVYYGRGRDAYDVAGRVAHEAIFNVTDGNFRCPGSQQGYSALTTWTRGLAWAMLGFAEQLEYLAMLDDAELEPLGKPADIAMEMLEAARVTCDFYIDNTPADGIPYWDTGAPGLAGMGDYLDRPSEPWDAAEPVDSSAAAIGMQGLLRLGRLMKLSGAEDDGHRYEQAGLTVARHLLSEPYLSVNDEHQGLILHSIYHRPNGWDHFPEGRRVPCGESSMWGDYHAREAALWLQRVIEDGPYLTFFGCAT